MRGCASHAYGKSPFISHRHDVQISEHPPGSPPQQHGAPPASETRRPPTRPSFLPMRMSFAIVDQLGDGPAMFAPPIYTLLLTVARGLPSPKMLPVG